MRKLRRTLGSFFRKLKYGFQRARRGFCDRDVWEINTWFLTILPKMLAELEKHHVGYPFSIKDAWFEAHREDFADAVREYEALYREKMSWREYFHFYYDLNDDHVEQYDQLWRDTLKRMAFLFSEAAKNKITTDEGKRAYYESCQAEGLSLFVKHFDDLWD